MQLCNEPISGTFVVQKRRQVQNQTLFVITNVLFFARLIKRSFIPLEQMCIDYLLNVKC